jgi:hypothetical protein
MRDALPITRCPRGELSTRRRAVERHVLEDNVRLAPCPLWVLVITGRQGNVCESALGISVRATRNPTLLDWLKVLPVPRLAEWRLTGLLFQPPPRRMRE